MLIEMATVFGAAVAYARHACDHETVTLHDGRLAVEQCSGSRVRRTEFKAPFVRVEAGAGNDALVTFSESGRRLEVGRHVQPSVRRRMATELHYMLRMG
jgi:uncharacterized membrane protein